MKRSGSKRKGGGRESREVGVDLSGHHQLVVGPSNGEGSVVNVQ